MTISSLYVTAPGKSNYSQGIQEISGYIYMRLWGGRLRSSSRFAASCERTPLPISKDSTGQKHPA